MNDSSSKIKLKVLSLTLTLPISKNYACEINLALILSYHHTLRTAFVCLSTNWVAKNLYLTVILQKRMNYHYWRTLSSSSDLISYTDFVRVYPFLTVWCSFISPVVQRRFILCHLLGCLLLILHAKSRIFCTNNWGAIYQETPYLLLSCYYLFLYGVEFHFCATMMIFVYCYHSDLLFFNLLWNF